MATASSSPVPVRASKRIRTSAQPRRSTPQEGNPPGTDSPAPEEFDFLSLLTMTVALFGLGTFSLVSLLGIIAGG